MGQNDLTRVIATVAFETTHFLSKVDGVDREALMNDYSYISVIDPYPKRTSGDNRLVNPIPLASYNLLFLVDYPRI